MGVSRGGPYEAVKGTGKRFHDNEVGRPMQIFKPSMHPARSAAALSGLALVLGGCANSPVAPEELAVPARLTCFDLAAPASARMLVAPTTARRPAVCRGRVRTPSTSPRAW